MTTDYSREEYFSCDCHDYNHIVKVNVIDWQDGSDPDFTLQVTASLYESFLERLWSAVKYAIGYEPLRWHAVNLNAESVERLQGCITSYRQANQTSEPVPPLPPTPPELTRIVWP